MERKKPGRWNAEFDEDGNLVDIVYEASYQRLLGYAGSAMSDISNESWALSIHPDDRSRVESVFSEAMEKRPGEFDYDVEYRMMTASGYRWFHDCVRAVRREDGSVARLEGVIFDIHETVRHEAVVEQSRMLKVFGDMVNAATWSMEIEGESTITSLCWSDEVRHMFGFEDETEFPNTMEAWMAGLHPDDRGGVLENWMRGIRSRQDGASYDIEYRFRRKDGRYRWYHAYGRVEVKSGDRRKNFGIVVDVSTEKALQRSSAREMAVRRIIKSAPWSVQFDKDRNIIGTEYSPELRQVLRNDFSDNDSWVQFIHPDDREKAVADSLATLRDETGSTPFDSEYRMLGRDGEYHWVRSAGRMVLSPSGGGELYGICIDIDDMVRQREKRNRELEDEKRRTEIVIDALHSAQWRFMISADDRIVGSEYSRDIGKLVRNEKASESHDWKCLVHPDDYPALYAAFTATLKDHTCRTPYDCTFRMIDRYGNYNWFRSVGNVFRHEDGTGEFFGIHVDVNERIQQECEQLEIMQQLEQSAAQAKVDAAEETGRAKTAFLANMSHDIRTPMNAIIGFTDIARKHVEEPQKIAEYLDKIELAGSNLLEIINDILDMSKIDSENIEITEYPAYISRMPAYFGTILSTRMKEHGHTFIHEANDLRDDALWVDKPHFNRILTNLLTNSVKYTPDGGTIRLSVIQLPDRREGYATYRIEIEDNGYGMSEEYQRHIFERFTREKTSTVSGIQGTGIGMSITKSLTDAMGGTIEVKSREGVGTKFTLVFDFRRRQPGEGETNETEEVRPHTEQVGRARKRILLVEDNEINREIGLEVLKSAGFEVDIAVNGQDAVDKVCGTRGLLNKTANLSFLTEHYDLILMDIMMPVMDGHAASRTIRAWEKRNGYKAVPIVALSANAFVEDREASLAAGMNDHLTKPIKIKPLMDVLRKFL